MGDPEDESSEDLNYNQIPSRSKAVIPLFESYNHEKAENIHEVDNGMIDSINIFDFETMLEEDDLDKWLFKAESNLSVEIERLSTVKEPNNVSLSDHLTKNNLSVIRTNRVVYKKEGSNDNRNVFDFETVSENDNLDDWLLRAENSSFIDKPDRITSKAGDTEYIRLTVKRNKFVSANGVEIEENKVTSSNIRALLNCLVDREQNTELTEDESDIKGMISADRKTIVEIVEDEKSRNEKSINVNSEDTVKDCHNGHPQISSANIGLLKMFDEPKPKIVKEGSEILIFGSAWIGEEPHWFQGELKEAPEPIVIKDRNNIIMAKCMEIHKPLLYNYWAEACSIKVEKPISVIIDKGLLEELELIITGQDPEKSRNTNDIFVTNEREEQIFEGLEIIFGMEIKTELDKARDMLTENGMKTEIILDIEVLQPGEDFLMIDNKKKEQLTNIIS